MIDIAVSSRPTTSLRGIYLAIEGPDGVGKSGTIERLVPLITERTGMEPVVVREPAGTPEGEQIRTILLHSSPAHPFDPRTELMLLSAARSCLLECVVRPALEAGRIVLSDRTALSSFAYQGGPTGVPDDEIAAVTRVATGGLWPVCTVVLMLDAVERKRRRRLRGRPADAFETDERIDRAARRYAELAERLPGVCLTSAYGSEEVVARRVFDILSGYLPERALGPLALASSGLRARIARRNHGVDAYGAPPGGGGMIDAGQEPEGTRRM